MKERPILFSAPMVRALLDGSKTQTRRPYKVRKHPDIRCAMAACELVREPQHLVDRICPYGQPGDRLWVRETFGYNPDHPGILAHCCYRADPEHKYDGITWKPSIHMPRAASRILLEIISVRVERLNDCSEADAKAEGVMQLDADDFQRPEERTKEGWALCPTCCGTGLHSTLGASGGVNFDFDCQDCDTHEKLYRHLWESINGAGSWAANPWVWVVEFKRVQP